MRLASNSGSGQRPGAVRQWDEAVQQERDRRTNAEVPGGSHLAIVAKPLVAAAIHVPVPRATECVGGHERLVEAFGR